MITTCTDCKARYQLEDDKVPRRAIRVRCPACSSIFTLDGTRLAEKPSFPPSSFDGFETGFAQPPRSTMPAPAPAATIAPADPAPVRQAAPAVAAVCEPEPEVQAAPATRRRRSKEEMLARALVSDILVYNRDQRDAALRDGTLVESLGGEIKKSWELYKEKVGADVANSTNHFRDALNEILADGQKVF